MFKRPPYAVRASLTKRAVAWGLTLTMLCPPVSGLLSSACAQAPVQPSNNPTQNGPALPPPLPVVEPTYGATSLLLFPFVNDTNNPSADALAGQVADALKLRIGLVGSYQVTSYTKFLAPVQRAYNESPQVLTDNDIAGPFDPQKAGKIAAQVQTNDYLTGSIESFSVDPTTKKVTIEVSANLRDTRTGNTLRTLAFTGTGIPFSNDDTLDAVTQRAVNAVASKIAAAIYPDKPQSMVVASSARGHSRGGEVFLLTLLTGALLYAVLHSGGGGGGGGGNSGSTSTGTTTPVTTGGPPSPPTVP
jgi:hypothetical protein